MKAACRRAGNGAVGLAGGGTAGQCAADVAVQFNSAVGTGEFGRTRHKP